MTVKTGELVKTDPAVAKIEQMLAQYKPHMAALLGKHMSVEQVFRIACLALTKTPKLRECTTASLLGCILESSRMRLQPGGGPGETWLIPFENKKNHIVECTLIVDYRAIIKMMKRDAGVEAVVAEKVCAKDKFRHGIASAGPFLEWEPAQGDRGAVVGYVAASWNKAKALTGVIYKTVKEIDETNKKKSMAAEKGDGPWKSDPEWMYKKSVLRPLGKLNPGIENDDLSRAVSLDERADLGLPQNLHLLADPTAKPELEDKKAKAYTASPTADSPAADKIAWVRAEAEKLGVGNDQFDAWLAEQKGTDDEKAAAVKKAWGRVVKNEEATAVFETVGGKKTEPEQAEEQEARFQIGSHATTDIDGDPDWYAIKDTEDPPNKYITKVEALFNEAKDLKKGDKNLAVMWVPKVVGKNTLRLIVRRIA